MPRSLPIQTSRSAIRKAVRGGGLQTLRHGFRSVEPNRQPTLGQRIRTMAAGGTRSVQHSRTDWLRAVHDQFSNLSRSPQAQQQYAKLAGQFCDIRALAIASARHEKAANLALERVGEAGNAARTPVTDSDVSLCDEIAKAVFCLVEMARNRGF
jgi:hypothetical protein